MGGFIHWNAQGLTLECSGAIHRNASLVADGLLYGRRQGLLCHALSTACPPSEMLAVPCTNACVLMGGRLSLSFSLSFSLISLSLFLFSLFLSLSLQVPVLMGGRFETCTRFAPHVTHKVSARACKTHGQPAPTCAARLTYLLSSPARCLRRVCICAARSW